MFVINQEGVLVYDGAIDSIRSADQSDIPRAENYVKETVADRMVLKRMCSES